jgi:hypothetical protein
MNHAHCSAAISSRRHLVGQVLTRMAARKSSSLARSVMVSEDARHLSPR